VCTWTWHYLTDSSLAVEFGKVALLHLLCSSSQLTGFFTVQTQAFLGRRWVQRLLQISTIADDIAFLVEMLEVLALDVPKDEARPLSLEVNWQKTKIQSTMTQLLLCHQFIYPAIPWMLWNHSSTLAVLIAQNQKCVAGLTWQKVVSTF